MEREIKFRIRLKDKESGGIISMYNNIFDAKVGVAWYEIDKNTWELISADQYTGLKDKNGKEIYEGDILKSFYGVGTYTVIFKHGTFGMQGNSDYLDDWNRPKNYGYSSFKDCDNGNIEIIGNIYENHELLK